MLHTTWPAHCLSHEMLYGTAAEVSCLDTRCEDLVITSQAAMLLRIRLSSLPRSSICPSLTLSKIRARDQGPVLTGPHDEEPSQEILGHVTCFRFDTC